ncbi:MAG: RimK/LysX family protein [Gammaproteobacteria bacterium]|nr:RimK/LysX family protein [Gammaproteobacteria bacterium]
MYSRVSTGFLLGSLLFFYQSVVVAANKQVIGWLETIHIGEAKLSLHAKIDTGADNSSIKAKILKKFERNGEEWVRFSISDRHDHSAVIERKVLRYADIKRKMALPIRRPVVQLWICLGNISRDVEVNLAARKNFKYHMLIGRSFLKGKYLVDSEQQYTSTPTCPGIQGDSR